MTAQAAQVCREAAAVIETRGHCKESLYLTGQEETGPVCMWGGIYAAMSGNAGDMTADLYDGLDDICLNESERTRRLRVGLEIERFFAEKFGYSGSVLQFPGAKELNDLPETTGRDVQKFLLQSADELEFRDAPAVGD